MSEAVTALDHPRCELGEGPTYDPHTDTAWWFDITGRALHEYSFSQGLSRVHALPFAASALARVDARRQALFTETGLVLRDVASGALTPLQAIEADDPETRSNDARVHPCGAMWLGTMGWDAQPGAGTIWHYRAGVLTRLFDGITITNAICFSPDGALGYFADTAKGTIFRVPLDRATGLPTGAPQIWRDRFDGGPDGAVVDAEGCLWVAVWGSASVVRYSPEGVDVARIGLPASQPSCPAFVGPKADRLLITTAALGLDRAGETDGLTHLAPLAVPGLQAPDLII